MGRFGMGWAVFGSSMFPYCSRTVEGVIWELIPSVGIGRPTPRRHE